MRRPLFVRVYGPRASDLRLAADATGPRPIQLWMPDTCRPGFADDDDGWR
ncbi:MAG: antitoxin MazE-like protein [Burkholderiales bacterium]